VSWPAFSSMLILASRRSMNGSLGKARSAHMRVGTAQTAIAAVDAPLRKERRVERKEIMISGRPHHAYRGSHPPCLGILGKSARAAWLEIPRRSHSRPTDGPAMSFRASPFQPERDSLKRRGHAAEGRR